MHEGTRSILSFEHLDERVDAYVKNTLDVPAGRLERGAMSLALIAAGITVLVAPWVGGITGLWMARTGLVVECVGFAVAIVLACKRHWVTLTRARRTFAIELDHDYRLFREYVAWLRGFPEAELRRRLRYVRERKSMMTYRLGLATGGIERLGLIPVLVALYLQFKDWSFGDWGSIPEVNLLGGLLLWALFLVYLAGWALIRLRSRMDTYEALLAEACAEGESPSSPHQPSIPGV